MMDFMLSSESDRQPPFCTKQESTLDLHPVGFAEPLHFCSGLHNLLARQLAFYQKDIALKCILS
jgi:hypothetical protein